MIRSKAPMVALVLLLLLELATHATHKPSFDEAMSTMSEYNAQRAKQNPLWRKAKLLYDNNGFDHASNQAYQVPNIIHHIWLGSELPTVCKELRQSWIEYHPTWTYVLWTDNASNYTDSALVLMPQSFDEIATALNNTHDQYVVINVENLKFSTKNQFIHSKNYGEKSDILRYEILFYLGGVYVDTDFKCIRAFDDIHRSCSFFAGLEFTDQPLGVFNSIIGSMAKHPICKTCMESIAKQSLDRTTGTNKNVIMQRIVIMKRTGPYFLSDIVRNYLQNANDNDTMVLFPPTFFYPYPHTHINKHRNNTTAEIQKIWEKPESVAMHLWHVSWSPK